MGKPTGFLEIARRDRAYAPVTERLEHWQEFVIPLDEDELSKQGARCMDCGIPYCHAGCPVNNIIPDFNDLVYRADWKRAIDVLHSTNNFPEFTGRVCPAPCEASCTLNLLDSPVTIKSIECAIVDKAWDEGWVEPQVPARRTRRKVAVVGSGPAGLACAQQLARAGHTVVVFERNAKIGGLLRYGIPDFKLEKRLIDRRVSQMQAEGVEFRPNSDVGGDVPIQRILDEFEAVALACGSEAPRDLEVEGRALDGVHYAMDYLVQQNKRVGGEDVAPLASLDAISAQTKDVVVIGGGDTGSDCVGTANRQGANSVTQLEIMPKPPVHEDKELTWPDWPLKLRTSSSHEEGCERDWSVMTRRFVGDDEGVVRALECVRVQVRDGKLEEIPDSAFEIPAQLVLLAMGFVHPLHDTVVNALDVGLDKRGNVAANTRDYRTSIDGIFACGDARRGQSLVVWAIREGRQCAAAIDEFLMGFTELPR